MRSYEAARRLFGFLGFCAWILIIFGALVAIGGMTAAGQISSFGRGPSGLAVLGAALPGIGIAMMGLVCLAIVQNGRAAVDTAEYTQQMLKIARDQLDVSNQALKQGKALQQSFADLGATEADAAADGPSFSARPKSEPEPAADRSSIAPPSEVAPTEAPQVRLREAENRLVYKGEEIKHENGVYLFRDERFGTLEAAHLYIDDIAEPQLLKLGGVTRDD